MTTKTKEYFVSVTYFKLNLWSEMSQFKTVLAKFPLATNNSKRCSGRENPTFSLSCRVFGLQLCRCKIILMSCSSDPNLDHNPRGEYSGFQVTGMHDQRIFSLTLLISHFFLTTFISFFLSFQIQCPVQLSLCYSQECFHLSRVCSLSLSHESMLNFPI